MEASIEMKAFKVVHVRPAAGSVVLFEHEHAVATTRENRSSGEPGHSASNNNVIDVVWNLSCEF